MGGLCLALLPGLDGTGDLFRPLRDVIPPSVDTRVISYPTDAFRSYSELLGLVATRLRDEQDLVLVAESFSGALALRYAAAFPRQVRGVVLCASFVRPPVPGWVRWFCKPALFMVPPPAFVMRRLMLGRAAPDALVRAVRDAIARVSPRVLAGRLADVLRIDAADALRECQAPVLYLAARGDAVVRRSALGVIRAVRGDVRVAEIDGPHLLLQREPAAAWLEIARFLATIGLGPAPRGDSCAGASVP